MHWPVVPHAWYTESTQPKPVQHACPPAVHACPLPTQVEAWQVPDVEPVVNEHEVPVQQSEVEVHTPAVPWHTTAGPH